MKLLSSSNIYHLLLVNFHLTCFIGYWWFTLDITHTLSPSFLRNSYFTSFFNWLNISSWHSSKGMTELLTSARRKFSFSAIFVTCCTLFPSSVMKFRTGNAIQITHCAPSFCTSVLVAPRLHICVISFACSSNTPCFASRCKYALQQLSDIPSLTSTHFYILQVFELWYMILGTKNEPPPNNKIFITLYVSIYH